MTLVQAASALSSTGLSLNCKTVHSISVAWGLTLFLQIRDREFRRRSPIPATEKFVGVWRPHERRKGILCVRCFVVRDC
jgi:hypothetical protein